MDNKEWEAFIILNSIKSFTLIQWHLFNSQLYQAIFGSLEYGERKLQFAFSQKLHPGGRWAERISTKPWILGILNEVLIISQKYSTV